MANAILTPREIAMEVALQVRNNLRFTNTIKRSYEKEWDKRPNGFKPGASIDIRIPPLYTVGTTATITTQDHIQLRKTITANLRANTAMKFGSDDLTLSLADFSKEVIQPAARVLASHVDWKMFQRAMLTVANTRGTAGVTPAPMTDIPQIRRFLTEAGCPTDQGSLYFAWCPSHMPAVFGTVGTLFNTQFTTELLRDVSMGRFGGFEHYESQTVPSHAFGTKTGGTAAVNGTAQGVVSVTGTTIGAGTIAGSAGTGTVNAGDTFTIAGVYSVNPLTKQSTGNLKCFVAASAAAFDTGTVDIITTEGLVTSGPYQNVSNAPTTNSAITFFGGTGGLTVNQSMAYHSDAFAGAIVPMEMPQGVAWGARETVDGVSVRIIKAYDEIGDEETTRLDMLFALTDVRPEWAGRAIG